MTIAEANRRPSPAQSGHLPRPAPALAAPSRRGVLRAGLSALAASVLGLGGQSDQTTAGKRRKPPYVFDRQWGSQGTGNGQFMHPIGIARAPSNGDIYIADTNNSRIQRFSSAGVFQTTWGSAGSADGQFNSPRGVAVDPETGVGLRCRSLQSPHPGLPGERSVDRRLGQSRQRRSGGPALWHRRLADERRRLHHRHHQ